ncbi:general transcription factor 3C polypeptide 5-like [Pomacea canaliculata]|uniref:general transcription factor 3C polypeptide 5-like n=1 Tax=Pomacea canaliculata TaxID=400727 RepID=UPI000D735DC4|nr:general transcription factor 3C polypeptide 5-like [Pomacea canaliculata]
MGDQDDTALSSADHSDYKPGFLKNAEALVHVPADAKNRFTCIEYPGVVQNVDKALETLGGASSISKALAENRKLELRFRPQDPYCKPAYGTMNKVSSLLLKVKRRRKSNPADSHILDGGDDSNAFEYKVEILGIITSSYKFQAMCDFQYLPFQRKENGSYESILDKLVVKPFMARSEFLARDTPLFLPPVLFSRLDMPQKYSFEADKMRRRLEEHSSVSTPESIMRKGRKRREVSTQFVSFEDKDIPAEPSPDAINNFRKPLYTELLDELKKLFEERPIWGKAGLRYRLRHNPSAEKHLKFVLPLVAYFFLNGPWRVLWVKYGYDPRKDPSAFKYQTVDFRLRHGPANEEVQARKLLARNSRFVRPKQPLNVEDSYELNIELLQKDDEPDPDKQPQVQDFEFHIGVLPPQRQMYYQLCDIDVPEISERLTGNKAEETICDEKNGWGGPNFTQFCREAINKYVEEMQPVPKQLVTSKSQKEQPKRRRKKPLHFKDDSDDDTLDFAT